MFRYLFYILCFISILAGCSQSVPSHQTESRLWKEENGKLKVLSTISMIDDLVKQIGGDYVDSLTLIKGDLDPHTYQLVKGDDEKFIFADIIFYNGLGLEHGPSLQHLLIGNRNAVPLGNKILIDDPSLILYENGQLDPHIWMDVSLWSKTIPYIVEALSEKDPSHAGFYKEQGINVSRVLEKKHEEIKKELLNIPSEKRYLVSSHDAFQYFTRAYLATDEEKLSNQWKVRFVAPEGLAPESQLSVHEIQKIIDHLTKFQIHVIFPESNVSKDSLRKIAQAGKEKGLDIEMAGTSLYADAMGSPGSDGDTYLKMVQHNVDTISNYLNRNGQGSVKK